MADRFLQVLKDCNSHAYNQLILEIAKYKKALNYVDEFMDSEDESLCKALDDVENKLQSDNAEKVAHKRPIDVNNKPTTPVKKAKTDLNDESNKSSRFLCHCGKSYKYRQGLHRHKKKCEISNTTEETNVNETYQCRYCSVPFDKYSKLVAHLEENHPLLQVGMGNVVPPVKPSTTTKKSKTTSKKRVHKTRSAINNSVQSIEILPFENKKDDLLVFYAKAKSEVQDVLKERRQSSRNVKFYLNTRATMVRDLREGKDSTATPYFRSKTHTILEHDDVEHDINSAFQQMSDNMQDFINKGSDWRFDTVVSMEIVTVPYSPLNGSSFLPLPPEFTGIRSLVNIKNDDNKCFLWSILAALHPAPHHAERLSPYLEFEQELNLENMTFPMPISSIPKFENQNAISVNVFGMEDGTIFPLHLSKLSLSRVEVDLLYLKKGEISHYCLIKDFNKFLSLTKKSANKKRYFCRRCLHGFIRDDLLTEHIQYCKQFDVQHVKYPEEGKGDILEFSNFHNQLKVPFTIYCDMETVNRKIDTCMPDPTKSSSTHETYFEPCGYAYKVVCCNENYSKPPVVYRGENAVEHLLENLLGEEEHIKDILTNNEPLMMNDEAEQKFKRSTECHICHKPFDFKKTLKVRDHYHIGVTGDINAPNYTNYRGAACTDCNLNFREPKFIPVVFHNLKGFDGHLFCHAIGKYKEKDIKCIAQNMVRYISTSLGDLRFIDSFQFMSTSLENLIENLSADGLTHFKHFRETFRDDEVAKLLLRKNVYPYDHMDSFERFTETQLPPKDAFYNRLKKEHISDEDYTHVKTVWSTLKMKTLGELHNHYVMTDVLLLADVFERFRDMTLSYYGIDACHYFTCPGLAWDAALKMTNVCLDLISDPLMYNFYEAGLRGGVSMISKRFSEANNPHVNNYDVKKDKTFLMYYDANNLYGGVMRMPLPTGMFRWLSDDEISNFDVHSILDDNKTGYTLEVDLSYPDELNDSHNCYPLAPEHKVVMAEELSPYNKKLWESLLGQKKRMAAPKLIPTLDDKKNYILHYRNLKLYLDLGLKCTKIHRILEFRQEPWLRPYIDFNSEKRKHARNDFERDFFKLMNNAVFGKTMENLRNRVDIKLIQTEKKLKKYCAKPSFERIQIFNDDLVGVENKKVTLVLNKPVYVGQTILDLSKMVMYDFHYNILKKKYGNSMHLLFTDTDSLMVEVN